MRANVKSYVMMHIGLFIMAAGLYFFLVPANLAVGGVTGLAMVLQFFFKDINLGLLMLVFNILLFGLAFIMIGRAFGGKTVYCSLLLSAIMGGFEWLVPLKGPFIDDVFINLIFGIIIQGLGMAIVFYENASTGGTDIVAKIINAFTDIPIGKALFLSDALITLAAGLIFGIELGLYAFLGILINGLLIDRVIESFDQKVQVLIVSEHFDAINAYINEEMVRGTTMFSGVGGYSKAHKNLINVVLSKKEYLQLKQFVASSDPKAFVTASMVHEVIGEGFSYGIGI